MWRIGAFSVVLLVTTLGLVSCAKVAEEETITELEEQNDKIRITEPKDGDLVGYRPYIQGTVADPDAEVWVIVHPINLSAYWVQPSVSVKGDGTWKVELYMGRAGDIDVGKQFEILAVANPKAMLNEADVLSSWPNAQWNSQVIKVTRR